MKEKVLEILKNETKAKSVMEINNHWQDCTSKVPLVSVPVLSNTTVLTWVMASR